MSCLCKILLRDDSGDVSANGKLAKKLETVDNN